MKKLLLRLRLEIELNVRRHEGIRVDGFAPPIQRYATVSVSGLITKKDGYACTVYFLRKPVFFASSVLTESQTNCPARFARDSSVKTKALIERQVCHQGAQASAKIGSFRARARDSACG